MQFANEYIDDNVIQNIFLKCNRPIGSQSIFRNNDNVTNSALVDITDNIQGFVSFEDIGDRYKCHVIIGSLNNKEYKHAIVNPHHPISFDSKNDVAELLAIDDSFSGQYMDIYKNSFIPNKIIAIEAGKDATIERLSDQEFNISLYRQINISDEEYDVFISKDSHKVLN